MPKRIVACRIWEESNSPKPRIPEIVVYTGNGFDGNEFRTNCDVHFVGTELNSVYNFIHSIVVISGTWRIFKNAKNLDGERYANNLSFDLVPGYYPFDYLLPHFNSFGGVSIWPSLFECVALD